MDVPPPDSDCLARYAAGDRDALTPLVERYLNLVDSAARRQLGGDGDRARDVTQQVFLLLTRKAAGLRAGTVLASWLLKVTRYECQNLLRVDARRRRRERKVAAMTPEAPKRGGNVGAAGDDDAARWAVIAPHLDAAMAALSAGDRDALVLRYFRNVPYDQAAAVLGATENSVRQRVHRALTKLRSILTSRGVTVTEATLGSALIANAVEAAPLSLKGLTLGTLAQHASAGITAKGALAIVASTQSNAVVAAALVVLATIGACVILLNNNGGGVTAGVVGAGPAANRPAATTRAATTVPAFTENADPGVSRGEAVSPPPRANASKPPRKLFDVIPALTYDEARGTRRGFDHIAYIESGNWVRYDAVDFGPAGVAGYYTFCASVMCAHEFAGRTIAVRLDNPDAPPVAQLRVRETADAKFVAQTAPIEGVDGGVHNVFLTFDDGGGFNLKDIKFVHDARPAVAAINATSYVEARGANFREVEKVLGDSTDGGWARYEVNFADGAGVTGLTISYATSASNAGGKIHFRLDKPDGPAIAEVPLTSTGGFRSFAAREVKLLQPVKGRHDVYLVFAGANGRKKGIADVEWFRFDKAPSPPATRPATAPATTRPAIAPQPFRKG